MFGPKFIRTHGWGCCLGENPPKLLWESCFEIKEKRILRLIIMRLLDLIDLEIYSIGNFSCQACEFM